MTRALPRIWIITDPDRLDGPVAPIQRALQDCPPGQVGVQLRAKRVSDRQLVRWGRELRAITARAGSPLVVNQRADVAQIIGADGVHLPERALPIEHVRRAWPGLSMIGVSRHDAAGLRAAEQDRATYAFLSPVFEVPDKAPPIGVEGFRHAIAEVAIPVFALGGIGLGDSRALLEAGAFGIAVRRALYGAADPGHTLQQLLSELDKNPPER